MSNFDGLRPYLGMAGRQALDERLARLRESVARVACAQAQAQESTVVGAQAVEDAFQILIVEMAQSLQEQLVAAGVKPVDANPPGADDDFFLNLKRSLPDDAGGVALPNSPAAGCAPAQQLGRIEGKLDGLLCLGQLEARLAYLEAVAVKNPLPESWATHRHYRGGLYRVLHRCGDATNARPTNHIVVYQNLETGQVWARDEREFDEVLGDEEEGTHYFRFEPIARTETDGD